MVNLTGTLNVLEAAKRNDVKKVIFASSSSVYGNNPLSSETKICPHSTVPYAVRIICGYIVRYTSLSLAYPPSV